MRFNKFLQENVVQDALALSEPEIGKKYPDAVIAKKKSLIQQAISSLEGKKMANDEAKEAMMADLVDKQEKWNNVEKETAPPDPPKKPEGDQPGKDDPTSQDDEKPVDADKSDQAKYPKKPDEKREDKEDDQDQEKEKDIEQEKKRENKEDDSRNKKNSKMRERLIKSKIKKPGQ